MVMCTATRMTRATIMVPCTLALLLFLHPSETRSHTKGITLSRFGLLDISVTGNVVFVTFDDEKKVNFDKLGGRHEEGFNLTSFDIAISGELPTLPMKFALFAAGLGCYDASVYRHGDYQFPSQLDVFSDTARHQDLRLH
jgi:hypothetical protein